MKAANEFKEKTTAPNQMWQTDFTYFKITGWGWYYISTILDDFSRYVIAWKLCTTMKAEDVTDTLQMALRPLAPRVLASSQAVARCMHPKFE
jgi:putative transposase